MKNINSKIINLSLIIIGLLLINACSDIHTQIKSIRSQVYEVQKLNNEVKIDKSEYGENNYLREFYPNGKLKRHLIYFIDEIVSKTEYIYDDKDSLIKMNVYRKSDNNLDLINSYSCEYENDSLKTIYVFDENNEVIRIKEFTYFDNGFRTLGYFKDRKDENKYLILREFNKKNQQISLKSNWVEGEFKDIEYSYFNDYNKLDSTLSFYGNKLVSKIIYTYEDSIYKQMKFMCDENINGDLYTINVYNLKDEIISYIRLTDDPSFNSSMTYLYSYDRYGNWIEQKVLLDKEFVSVIKREIEYYD